MDTDQKDDQPKLSVIQKTLIKLGILGAVVGGTTAVLRNVSEKGDTIQHRIYDNPQGIPDEMGRHSFKTLGITDLSGDAIINLLNEKTASEGKKLEILQRLLAKGADIKDLDFQGRTPLGAAVANNLLEIATFLIENGALPNSACDGQGSRPIHYAARTGEADLINMLLESNADPNEPDNMGRTSMHWAASQKNPDIITMLHQSGGSTSTQDELGNTPLFYAVRDGVKEAIEELLRLGANPDHKNAKGYSVKEYIENHYAADPEIVRQHLSLFEEALEKTMRHVDRLHADTGQGSGRSR